MKGFQFKERRKKTPVVIQLEAVECGAAALCSVMGYYKKFISLEKMRYECGISRDGCKALNMVKAAERFGFEADALSVPLEELKKIEPPYIIHWNFNHFLVVEGIEKDKIYLNDPSMGSRIVDPKTFDSSYTGVLIKIQPGPDFKPEGSAPSLINGLIRRLSGTYTSILFFILIGLALVIPGFIVPIFAKIFVDNILIAQLHSWLQPLLIGMGITLLFTAALTWLQNFYHLRFQIKLSTVQSSRFLSHLLKMPIEFFQQRLTGDIASRISLNSYIATSVVDVLIGSVLNAFMSLFYLVLMFYFSSTLTFFAIGLAVINLLIMQLIASYRKNISLMMSVEKGKLFGVVYSGLALIETLKASGRENDLFKKVIGNIAHLLNVSQESKEKEAIFFQSPIILTIINSTIILSFGGLYVMQGKFTIGTLIAFQSLSASFLYPIMSLVSRVQNIQTLAGDINRVDDVFNYPAIKEQESIPVSQDVQLKKLSGNLELRQVSFGYSPLAAPLIEDFSLCLRPGMRISIVGHTGSGKSTIAKLMMRLYKPWSGELLIDNQKMEEIPREILSSSIAMVDQDILMFEGTIKENLTMWNETISDEDVLQATKDALIHSDIAARKGGYDAMIAESGANFGSGQLQQLEIARALVGNPTILILDEATSALDPIIEMKIDDNIRRRGCATVIIAHRLSTIRDSDLIIVLDKGKVVEQGTHDELFAKQHYYTALVETTG